LLFFSRVDPIPEPFVDESAKQAKENEATAQDQFDASLPPELRKLMEQAKQREDEAAAAAAAAEAQLNKEESMIDRSGTQPPADQIQDGKELTQASLDRKDDDKLYNGRIN